MNQHESETHRVVIAKLADEYIIEPRTLKAEVGDEVAFSLVNIEEPLTLLFPDPDLFGKPSVQIGPSDDCTLSVREESRKKIHSYAIYREEGRSFIGFHSRGPVIIIYR
jgi:hypothetical protein